MSFIDYVGLCGVIKEIFICWFVIFFSLSSLFGCRFGNAYCMVLFGSTCTLKFMLFKMLFKDMYRWVSNSYKCGINTKGAVLTFINKGNNKITELRTILQRESPNS